MILQCVQSSTAFLHDIVLCTVVVVKCFFHAAVEAIYKISVIGLDCIADTVYNETSITAQATCLMIQ